MVVMCHPGHSPRPSADASLGIASTHTPLVHVRIRAGSDNGADEDKLRFAFEVYDLQDDNAISNGELYRILAMMVRCHR